MKHTEKHRSHRAGWLRAAVLGANDGIISTASLMIGIAASQSAHGNVLITGVAGLVAGAMSMAAGEYVSVHSQADTESADLEREKAELAADPLAEKRELTAIYTSRGLSNELAAQVANELMAHDALAAHARDELGISDLNRANPLQAALVSATCFASGAALPVAVIWLVPETSAIVWLAASSLLFLGALGAIAAKTGGSSAIAGALRVAFWGSMAMAATAGAGRLFGAVV